MEKNWKKMENKKKTGKKYEKIGKDSLLKFTSFAIKTPPVLSLRASQAQALWLEPPVESPRLTLRRGHIIDRPTIGLLSSGLELTLNKIDYIMVMMLIMNRIISSTIDDYSNVIINQT